LIGIQKREEGDELTEALELTKNEKL